MHGHEFRLSPGGDGTETVYGNQLPDGATGAPNTNFLLPQYAFPWDRRHHSPDIAPRSPRPVTLDGINTIIAERMSALR